MFSKSDFPALPYRSIPIEYYGTNHINIYDKVMENEYYISNSYDRDLIRGEIKNQYNITNEMIKSTEKYKNLKTDERKSKLLYEKLMRSNNLHEYNRYFEDNPQMQKIIDIIIPHLDRNGNIVFDNIRIFFHKDGSKELIIYVNKFYYTSNREKYANEKSKYYNTENNKDNYIKLLFNNLGIDELNYITDLFHEGPMIRSINITVPKIIFLEYYEVKMPILEYTNFIKVMLDYWEDYNVIYYLKYIDRFSDGYFIKNIIIHLYKMNEIKYYHIIHELINYLIEYKKLDKNNELDQNIYFILANILISYGNETDEFKDAILEYLFLSGDNEEVQRLRNIIFKQYIGIDPWSQQLSDVKNNFDTILNLAKLLKVCNKK